jgi:hypothetical protein
MPGHTAGERNGAAKLNEKSVKEIRKVCNFKPGIGYEPGSIKTMAEKYEISGSAVRGIASGKTWTHVK